MGCLNNSYQLILSDGFALSIFRIKFSLISEMQLICLGKMIYCLIITFFSSTTFLALNGGLQYADWLLAEEHPVVANT